jgi:hypothetical protein
VNREDGLSGGRAAASAIAPRALAAAVLLAGAAMLGACESAADKVWTKPGATEGAFADARTACRAASARTPLDPISVGFGERFQACMEHGGWQLIDRPAAAR